jgi:hypothetical protein
VVSDNKKVGDAVIAAATEEFRKHTDFELSQKLPLATLFLYVNQDVNDKENPDGWSVAIAHAENVESLTLAGRLIDSRDETAKALKPVLISMINKPGFQSHLNVAHIDEISDENVKKLVDSVVSSFSRRSRPTCRRDNESPCRISGL